MSSYPEVSALILVDGELIRLTRCKDCKFGWENMISGHIFCQRDGRHLYEMVFDPYAFCSYGQPKEEDNV